MYEAHVSKRTSGQGAVDHENSSARPARRIAHQVPETPGHASHPTNATFCMQTGDLAEKLCRHCAGSDSRSEEGYYQAQAVDHLYRKALTGTIREAVASGLALSSAPNLTERARLYAEDWSIAAARREVVEGQNPDLNGSHERASRLKSKSTAFTSKDAPDSNWSPLTGKARLEYNSHIQTALNKGNPVARQSILLNQQKAVINAHLIENAGILSDFILGAGLLAEGGGGVVLASVNGLLKQLGIKRMMPSGVPLTLENIRSHIVREGAAGSLVWTVAEGAARYMANPGPIYEGMDQGHYFDHDAGRLMPVVGGSRIQADKPKVLQVLAERELDKVFEAEVTRVCKEQGYEAVRFSGNSFNVPGLYGAPNAGLDGAREATFRAKLRMTAKRLVIDQMEAKRATSSDLGEYIDSLNPVLVREFLDTLGAAPTGSKAQASQVLKALLCGQTTRTACFETLKSSYSKLIFGPCGTLQGAMNHVGGVLGAVQHVTGQTSLWCMHNGDFEEVGGLQADPGTRTYMKLDPQSQLYNLYADNKELKTGANGTRFIPVDCVHSQAYLNIPGVEEETTVMLRLILSDIVPDVSRLQVRIAATSTLNNGADLPYVGGQGEFVIGSSRFATYPHGFSVSKSDQMRSQEDMIIEAVEFTFDGGEELGVQPLFLSTQNHDDAAKGNRAYVDFGDDSAIKPRSALDDGGERTLFNKVIVQNILQRQPETTATSKIKEAVVSQDSSIVSSAMAGALSLASNALTRIFPGQAAATQSSADGLVPQAVDQLDSASAVDELVGLMEEHRLFDQADSKLASNREHFEAVTLKGSPASLLFEMLFKESKENYSAVSKEGLAQRIANNAAGMDPKYVLAIRENLSSSVAHIGKWLNADLSGVAVQAAEATEGVGVYNRPRDGWQDGANRPVLPSGIVGSVAVPSTVAALAGVASASASALGGLGKAALGGLATSGAAATGAILVGQGLVMENAAGHIARRLGKISESTKQQYIDLYELRESLRTAPDMQATRNNLLRPLIGLAANKSSQEDDAVTSLSELVAPGGAVYELESLVESAPADQRQNLIDGLGLLRDKLTARISVSPDLTVDEVSDFQEAAALGASMAHYLGEQADLDAVSKKRVEGVRSRFENVAKAWSDVLKTDVYRMEADVTNEMATLAAALDDTNSAKVDNKVMRWTGRAYGLAGAGLVASVTPIASIIPALGPIATGVLSLAYGANYLNTRRNLERTAKAELGVNVRNRQPWAPKVVGFHRELLARQAEQVESDSARNRGMAWRTMGWGVGGLAMGGLTLAGALTATVFSGGIALPVILGAGAGFSLAGSVATFNLFNRHAVRNSPFGPRPGATQHLDGVTDSTSRKRFFWGASKQAGQINEQRQLLLERIGQGQVQQKRRVTGFSNSPMTKTTVVSARSLPGRFAASLDPRGRFNEFVRRFVNPNYTSVRQVKAIKKALASDWNQYANQAAYAMRLYAEHEANFLRDKASYLEDRRSLFSSAGQDSVVGKQAGEKSRVLAGQVRQSLDATRAVSRFMDRLDAFQNEFSRQSASKNGSTRNLEPQFKGLINEFIHSMGLVGHTSSRGGIKKLLSEGSTSVKAETYGKGGRYIANINVDRAANLAEDLALRNHLEGKEYKNFGNLMTFVLPELLNYEIEKVQQTELTTRRSDFQFPRVSTV